MKQRSLKAIEGFFMEIVLVTSRCLVRNQRFNVKIEDILENSQQQGKAGRRRFMFQVLGQEITNVPRLARYGNVNGSPMIRRTNLKSDSLDFARHK